MGAMATKVAAVTMAVAMAVTVMMTVTMAATMALAEMSTKLPVLTQAMMQIAMPVWLASCDASRRLAPMQGQQSLPPLPLSPPPLTQSLPSTRHQRLRRLPLASLRRPMAR